LCERKDFHGDGDQYEFPDGSGISPEGGAAVLGRASLYLGQVGAAKELIQELKRKTDAASTL